MANLSRGEEMLEANARTKGNPEWGYKLNFAPNPSEVSHEFCGPNNIIGALCPNCNKPLLRLLSLDAKDRVLNLDASRNRVVHLLYCWTCSIPFGEFSYQIKSDGRVQILEIPPKYKYEFRADGPYEGYTGVFLHRMVSLEPLSDTQQRELEACQTQDDPNDVIPYSGHQVGDYPLIYNPCKAFCPTCSKEMPLLAAFCDNAIGNDDFTKDASESFTGNCGVRMVFQFCRDCCVVTAYHSCD
jgi:hypothetical protein